MRIYDRPEISAAYFFPRPCDPLPRTEHAAPLDLRSDDGTRLGAYWCRPFEGATTMLYLHGNGEIIADQLEHWPRWAAAAGANILFVDYPGYATSDGSPSLTGCCRAATAALGYLLDRPPGEVPRVIVAGRSVGSIFAIDAASARADDPRIGGLMLESGIADLVQRFEDRLPYERLGIDRQALFGALARDFDHQAKLERLRCPVLVLHTRDDGLVPCWHGEHLARWAGERLHHLELFDRGDHNTIQWLNAKAYRALVLRFVAEVALED